MFWDLIKPLGGIILGTVLMYILKVSVLINKTKSFKVFVLEIDLCDESKQNKKALKIIKAIKAFTKSR